MYNEAFGVRAYPNLDLTRQKQIQKGLLYALTQAHGDHFANLPNAVVIQLHGNKEELESVGHCNHHAL
jgi:hypothetical protein